MDLYLLIASLLVIAAILSTRATERFGLPALVLFVLIGMLAGSSGPGGIVFDDYALSLDVGLVALAVILFSGGLDTRMRLFRASLTPALSLATVGVVVTMLVIGGATWLLTPLGVWQSLLLGAVLAPTDAAATFSVLKGRGIPARLRGVLETESGTNDPVGIYLTMALTTVLVSGNANGLALVWGIVVQLVLGGLAGLLWGFGLAWLLNRVRLEGFGLYPLLALAGGFLAYSSTNLIGGNGFLAVYLAGLVVGNRRVPHRQNLVNFTDGLASCERTTTVVSHQAFAYLERYGLDFEPIAGLSPDAEPTAADLGHLQEVIEADGVTTVFSERLVSPKMAETLADDLGVTTAVLDPIEGLSDDTAEEDYLSLMRANLAALQQANGCS